MEGHASCESMAISATSVDALPRHENEGSGAPCGESRESESARRDL